MREIKFRARDAVTGEILTQLYMGQCFQWVNHERQNNVVIEQFTGLKDKNGTEIYEGDIILIEYNRLGYEPVVFNGGVFNASRYDTTRCVVVGNIHENKDLLK